MLKLGKDWIFIMEKAFEFDFVHDTQYVFRKLLDAEAHPFKVYSMDDILGSFENNSVMCALGCTLLDNETSFYVEKDAKLAADFTDLTLAEQTSVSEADYIFLSSQLNYETIKALFEKAKKGTLADPQLSACFIICCDSVHGDCNARFRGPGIEGTREINTTRYIKKVCELKQDLDCDYPCGIDLFFVTADGDIAAAPRLCKLETEGD